MIKTIEEIAELMKIEQEYITERLNNIDNINFPEVLANNGLTIEEFQYEKGEYYLKTFKPTFIVIQPELIESTQTYESTRAMDGKNTFICGIPAQRVVWYSQDDMIDKEYCDANNIFVRKRPYLGGTICSMPSDLDVSIIANNAPENFSRIILDKMVQWIQPKITNIVSINNNDILIDGEKVFGMGNYTVNGITICGFHVSFDIDLDYIQKVCKKEIKKVPVGLSKFGEFNREELMSVMVSWLN